ncbi:MAG: response regulator transcription factor, partial [Chitinophagaceae bacterium]
ANGLKTSTRIFIKPQKLFYLLPTLKGGYHASVRGVTIIGIHNNFPASLISEAKDAGQAIACIKATDYELVIMDINMPDTDSQQLLDVILFIRPDTKVIVFSMHKEAIFGKIYLRKGAMGYVEKDEPDEVLIRAITVVFRGNMYMSEGLKTLMEKENKKSGPAGNVQPSAFDILSDKELEVLGQLVKGDTINKIAATMNLAHSTIGTHKARILRKLGLENLLELIEFTQVNRMG